MTLRIVLALLVFGLPPVISTAEAPRMVRVAVDLHHAGVDENQKIGAGGGIVITERGGIRPRARVGAEDTTTRTHRTAGLFTLVQDGGEASLTVATELPYVEVAYWRDFLTGAGYVAPNVVFREVGTSLKVRADILPGDRVRVRLTPRISYLSATGGGAIDVTEASNDLVVASGQPVMVGGATSRTSEVTRRILGFGRAQAESETTITLTATVR